MPVHCYQSEGGGGRQVVPCKSGKEFMASIEEADAAL
eukprot:CAMPEP_0172751620 /NCGR_PEP_ID=MMETSP1074-20121228/152134_1 /TAXON_ID=2916 /ORGANISM="Ceratium fusus, Strain PA161109" /LENGTH=36 /DNA_ID= /DNA_START= /DNA_END= /DNA_ORIENTATION=